MMAFLKFLTSAVLVTALILNLTIKVDACTCMYLSVCQGFEAADVVLRATVLSRSKPAEEYGDITYTLETKRLYKGEPNVKYGEQIRFVTAGSSAACGVTLELGRQHLVGLYRSNEGNFTANSCGLARLWKSVAKEDRASLRSGCEVDVDLCDGSCGKYQRCLIHRDDNGEEAYCADVCDPSPCKYGEKCSLEQLVQCVRAPCPANAVCDSSKA